MIKYRHFSLNVSPQIVLYWNVFEISNIFCGRVDEFLKLSEKTFQWISKIIMSFSVSQMTIKKYQLEELMCRKKPVRC